MKRLSCIKIIIFIIFLGKFHQTTAGAIKAKLLKFRENEMSLVEVTSGGDGDSERKKKKKLIVVDALLFLIQRFTGKTIDDKSGNNPQDTDCDRDCEEDAEKAFLLSLLPDFKSLDDNEKLEFRLHTLQFFKNIRNENNKQQQITQQPGFGIQLQNPNPMLSQYFLNYHSQQSLFPGNSRDNYFAPSYPLGVGVGPGIGTGAGGGIPNPQQPFPSPTFDNNHSRRPEPIFCDSLANSKNLDDYLLDLK